jgi:hypothetical protein
MLFKQSGVTKGPGTSQVCFLPSNMPRIWQKLLPTNNSVDGSCGTVCVGFQSYSRWEKTQVNFSKFLWCTLILICRSSKAISAC